MVSYNKKAISPVVATALLLVVAVVAVVGFQSWFTTYQSGINVKVEQESQAGSSITIERMEQLGTVYVKNTAASPVNVTVTIPGGASCDPAGVTFEINASSIASGAVPSCNMAEGSVNDVVVVTDSGVFQASMIAR